MAVVQLRINTEEVLLIILQLAVGELGLAVDTRRLYIGNGGSDVPE